MSGFGVALAIFVGSIIGAILRWDMPYVGPFVLFALLNSFAGWLIFGIIRNTLWFYGLARRLR